MKKIIYSLVLLCVFILLPAMAPQAGAEDAATPPSPLEAEKHFDMFTYTRWLPSNTVEAMPGTVSVIESGGEAKYDFSIFGKIPLAISAAFDYINIQKSIPRSMPASLISPGITLEGKLPLFNIKNTYIGASVNPSFSCDMNSFGSHSFFIPTTFVIIYVPNSKLTFIGGPQFFTDFDNDTQIVGGVIYKPTDKLTINLTTEYPHITYKINDKLDLLAEGQWVIFNQYKVHFNGNNDVTMSYREAWVGGGFRFRPFKGAEISLAAGGVFNRQLRFRHAGQKIDIDKGYYLQGIGEISF